MTLTGSTAHTNESKKQINRLRGKIASLKGEITSHQESRRQYRNKLREADQVISKLSSQQQIPDVDSEQKENPDSALLMPKKVLIPVFTNSFRKSCDSLQQTIVAKALRAAAGYAARDDGILRQTTGLERLPGVFRIRIGLHYRLLVRQTQEDTLQVMDIIPRSQLETWIRRNSR